MGSVISKILDEEREYRPLFKPVNKESVIKWQTGEPKGGAYLVTYRNTERLLNVCSCLYSIGGIWYNGDMKEIDKDFIVAWCRLSDIEPYKEETK